MKRIKVLAMAVVAVACMGVITTSCGLKTSVKLNSTVDTLGYAIGVSVGAGYGENLKTIPGESPDVDMLIAGFTQAIKGDSTQITSAEAQAFLQAYFTELSTKESSKAKDEGANFLSENKTKEGVVTTDSGLQYKVITKGTGAKPTADQTVKVHYTGTLLDGTTFDSSVDRGEPIDFGVSQVIKGWTEGLQLMPVGSKYIFWIPSELAYGANGNQSIKPNSMLTFEVELLDIVKK